MPNLDFACPCHLPILVVCLSCFQVFVLTEAFCASPVQASATVHVPRSTFERGEVRHLRTGGHLVLHSLDMLLVRRPPLCYTRWASL